MASSCPRHLSSSIRAVVANDDLLTEILSRVPAKSVLKFKLVSKKWLSIISHSTLAIRHTHLNPHTTSALLLKVESFVMQQSRYIYVSLNGKSLFDISYDFHHFDINNAANTHIIQSCNGLLLCSKFRGYSPVEGSKPTAYVFNSATRQFAILPPVPPSDGIGCDWILLAFDPAKSPTYKVVCADFYKSVIKIHVYSSETKDWKLCVKQENFDSLAVKFQNGVFWNGALHWISPMGNGFSFLFDKECLQTIPRPPLPEYWHDKNFLYFGESGGHLHFIGLVVDKYHDKTIVVYAMEKAFSEWFVNYCLRMDTMFMAYPEMIEDREVLPAVLSFIEGNDETGPLLVMYIPGGIISYSFKDNTFRNIWSTFATPCFAFKYNETLSWV